MLKKTGKLPLIPILGRFPLSTEQLVLYYRLFRYEYN